MKMDFKKNILSIIVIYNLFQLSMPTLYAASFVDPSRIFPTTSNEKIPSKYWLGNKKPYPTNAWFINLVLHQTNNSPGNAVNIFPYSMKINPQGISLSYTGPIFYAEPEYPSIISAFYYQFENQLTLGSNVSMNDYGLASYHGLRITLQWQNAQQKMTGVILQGSPYLTEFFTNTSPQLSTGFKIRSINQQTKTGPLEKTQRYELILALNDHHTQTWILYSEKPILFNWSINSQGEYLIASEPYSGWIRLVLQKDDQMHVENDAALLDAYSQTIPLDYQQDYFVTDQEVHYSLSWQTQNNKPPLMLSLPHQRNTIPQRSSVAYPGIKGLMLGETKAQWNIRLPKSPILFLEPKNLSSEQATILRTSLVSDADDLLHHPFPDDGPYQVGKRYARAARLILIANYIKEYTLQKQMLAYLETHLRKKMLAKTSWRFQYDTTWGGIIPSINEYGARHYNDHHYHYGYWVYTFAVIAQFDREWLTGLLKPKSFSPKQWIETLIRDYANEDRRDPYFPVQRYQDDYAGHSWASGLTSFVDGQNQQSSSEAVNAYYAIALYATALHHTKLLDWAQFLMTRELVSAQTYWQIPKDSAIYSDKFKEHNQVVANLWENKIDANPFFVPCKAEFRCGLEYSLGIEMLPFTAITLELLNKKWLKDVYPTIKKWIANEYGLITPAWQWILIKGVAPIMDKTEKEYFLRKAMDSKPADYDHGDSKTNTLYFLM